MTENVNGKDKAKKEKTKRTKSKTAPSAQSSKVKKLAEQVEQLTKEIKEANDKYLRLAAEFDNYKKRREREIRSIIESANQQIFLDLLPVIDDFERSLTAASEKKNYKILKDGYKLIYKKLLAVLAKQGLEPIVSLHQPFDPQFHEALMQVEVKDKQSNIIVEEALKGYRLKEKVIRPARVIVNK